MRSGRFILVMSSVIALVAVAAPAAAEGPTWVRRVGRGLEAVTTDASGAVYVTGWIWSPESPNAMVVAKFGPAGRELWRRTWRPQLPDRHATGTAIAAAPRGGVYVGAKSGYGEGTDAVVFRFSSSGRPVWRRAIPGTHVVSLEALHRGVVAAVQTWGASEPCSFHEGRLVALAPDGEPRWSNGFEAPGITGTFDAIDGVATDGRGTLFVSGTVDRTTCDPSEPQPRTIGLVQRFTVTGALRWSRVFSDPDRSRSAGAVAARDGLVVVALHPNPSLVALSTAGQRRWSWWGRGDDTAVEISPWGPIYVGGGRWRPDAITSYIRRFSREGALVRERTAAVGSGWLTDLATSSVVYASVDRMLQRWPR
jgi:hypothetical protein